jgi:SAM-dependent methyltransferase
VTPLAPAWPLPRHSTVSDDEIRSSFGEFTHWHYAYAFEGGVSFAATHEVVRTITDAPERPLQRFSHFMPDVLAANGGSIEGLRVLDIACNSGFWSIQCALLGAQVTGFDARPELIAQANLVKRIVGVDNVDFRLLNFFDMTPEALGGTFDVVLNLGVLYHLPEALDTLERTYAMATKNILLDTGVHTTSNAAVYVRWENPYDIHAAADPGIVALPSRSAIDLMLEHVGASSWYEIPLRSDDIPLDYVRRRRTSWMITV